MTENTSIPFDASSDDLSDDIPLGNYTPLLVPPSLGQSFLQPKFIYPLGAVSLLNPDNLAAENDFEPLNNSFEDSPFFDQPLQSNSLTAGDGQTTNQPDIQTKAIVSKNNLQRQVQTKRSPIDSPKSDSIQRQTLDSSQAQSLNSPLNLSSQEFSVNPSIDHDFQSSLDANISENTSIQRSDDLSIIDSTNSNSDRPEQIQRTFDRSSANLQNPQLPLNSNSPVLETSIEQSNQSNQDKLVQRQTDTANLAFANNNLLEGDRPNQTESNLFTVDTNQSPVVQRQSEISNTDNISQGDHAQQIQPSIDLSTSDITLTSDNIQQIQRYPATDNISQGNRLEKIPKTSDSSTTNIRNPQIQLNSNLPATGSDTVINSFVSDRTIQRESTLVDTDNIPQASQVPQADALQGQANIPPVNNPVNNISQVDLTQPIQRQPDLSSSDRIISTDKNTQPIQRSSESRILDNVAEGDRTIQQEPDLSPVDRRLISQTDEVQRQPDISSVDSISQGDLTQQIQRQTDLSLPENTITSTNTQQTQRFAESSVLDRVSEIDRTIQREPDLSSVDNTQSSQSDPLQKQSGISNENTIPEINPAIQRKSNLAATNITQSPQADAIGTQSNITVDDISQGDRTIQREPLGTVTNIPQSDEVQRQTDVDRISQGGYTPQIQRQSDLANADSSIDSSNSTTSNIQPIQRQPETPVLDSISQSDRIIQRESELFTVETTQISQTDEIQRQPDISSVDSSTTINSTQSIQRFPETSIASESDLPIHQSSTLSNTDISQSPQTTSVQRQTDQTNIADLPDSDSSSTSNNSQQIQSSLESAVLKDVPEGDRTIQRKSNLVPTDGTMIPTDEIQRQPDVSVVNSISESDRTQPIQRQSDLSVANSTSTSDNIQSIPKISESPVLDNITQNNRTIQREPDLFNNVNIAQLSQTDHIQQSDVASVESISQSNTIQRETDLSPVDIKQNAQTNEAQRQTELNVIDSSSQSDLTIQQEPNLSAKDVTQVSQPNSLQKQSDTSTADNISEGDHHQLIQTKPDISTSDSSTNRNSPQQRLGNVDISTVDIISGDIQRESNLSPDPTQSLRTDDVSAVDSISQGDLTQQTQQTDSFIADQTTTVSVIQQIQRESDLLPVNIKQDDQINQVQRQPDLNLLDSFVQSDRTIQREIDLSDVEEITQSLQTDSLQKLSDDSKVDHSIPPSDYTQQIQRQPDLSVSDRTSTNDNIQPILKTSESPALDNITQNNLKIQREPDLSAVDNKQDSQTRDVQRQSDVFIGNDIQSLQGASESSILDSFSEGDRAINRESNLSNADITQISQTDAIQRQTDIPTVGSTSEGIQRESNLSPVELTQSPQTDATQRIPDVLAVDNISQSDRTQQVQRHSDIASVGISKDTQTYGIQRQTDILAVDSIAEGDRTIQRNTDLSPADITQTSQAEDIQRQPDISIVDNNISEDTRTQQIQRTSDLPDSDSAVRSNIQQIAASEPPVLDSLSEGDRTQQIQTKADVSTISTSDISTNRDSQQIQRFSDTDSSDVDINSEDIQRKTNLFPVDELTQSQNNTIQRQSDVSLVDNTDQGDRAVQRETDLFNNVDTTQSLQTNDIQRQSNISVDGITQGNIARQIQQTDSSISDSNATSNAVQQIQRQADLPPLEIKQDSQTNEIQRQTDISLADSISQSDRTQQIQRQSDVPIDSNIQPVSSFSESPILDGIAESDHSINRESNLSSTDIMQITQTDAIQRQTDISSVDSTSKDIQRESNLSPADITQTPQNEGIQRQTDISTLDNNISEDTHTQQVQRISDVSDLDSNFANNIQQIERASELPIVDSLSEDNRTQQIQTKADVSTSDNSTNRNSQQIQRFSDTDISDVAINSDLLPVEITQSPQTNDIQRQSNILVDAITQGDLAQKTDLSISDSNATNNSQQIQRESFADHTYPSDRSIQREPDLDLSAVDIKQDSQTNEIQRQPDISLANSISQSDRVIQQDPDLSPADITQTPQPDGIQRQIDVSTVDNNISEGDHTQKIQRASDLSNSDSNSASNIQQIARVSELPILDSFSEGDRTQQIQPKADVPNSDISTNRDSQQIQRFSDVDISAVDSNSDLSSIEITQSPQTNDIQRQSNISVDAITPGDLTQQIQQTDLSIDAIQRQSDVVSMVDSISQVDRIQPIQRDLDPSDVDNVDRTLAIDHTNLIQRDTDLVNLNPEVSSQILDNFEHDNLQHIQKKADPKKDEAINSETRLEHNDNQTIIQMLADPSNSKDLQLPKAIENLVHTEYLGNFSSLPSLQIPSPMTSQTVQRSPTDRHAPSNLSNSLNNFAKTIQPKQDNNSDNSQTSSMGWSNISELLANLPPPKVSSSTSSLNKQTTSTSDRSPLASPSSPSKSSTSNQTTIQRSPDQTTYADSDIDQDLYLTPAGLQKGNPNKITNNRSNTIQRELTSETLPEAKVSVNPHQNQDNDSYDEENFDKNLETLAQEIYILLRQRLEIEKERQGGKYQGRLPW
ncbi:hypothetical protein B9G53_00620 [Pseudanabaena sp. SR411]|uniref:hypothetical protein n=1 Tax=Pseudanabaena sp. SR411 TaxID=1980935 RepID=UPI000B98E66B|nr:hypothetical protein [Pseudanabaena sp. SR411]OYQ67753.1 hypothetical protein B9G53_00620 [Pseudanabaena sp. SR411]